jgi:FkbM family methyltransferase
MYFDIGANFGRWAMTNIDRVADKIICVEASPITYQRLMEDTKGISKIECLNYAVCNSTSQDIEFYHCAHPGLSTLNKEWLTSEQSRFYNMPYETVTCKTTSLDTLIAQYGIPDLIKIDVEGGELECLLSLTGSHGVPKELCFEWASEMNHITFPCIDHLVSLGFTKFHLQYEDRYDYRPPSYECTADAIKGHLQSTTPKVHWGMVWCSVQ